MEDVKVILSKKFSLIWRDYIRGAAIAAGTGALTAVGNIVAAGSFNIPWIQVATAGVAAGIVYLTKNGAFEPSQVITTVHPDADAEVVKEEIKNAVL